MNINYRMSSIYKSPSQSFSVSSIKKYDYFENIKRFNDYKVIDDFLSKVKLNKDTCLKVERDKYLLGDSVLLYKKIGTESVYGVIYKCKNVNTKYKTIPFFTIKIQLNTNALKRETGIFIKLSRYGLDNKIPNLPILYKVIKCSDEIPNVLIKKADKALEDRYTMILNELPAGDLRTFLSKYSNVIDDRLWRNTYAQVFISRW